MPSPRQLAAIVRAARELVRTARETGCASDAHHSTVLPTETCLVLLIPAVSRLERALHPTTRASGAAGRRTLEVSGWPDAHELRQSLLKLSEQHDSILAIWKLQQISEGTALCFRAPREKKGRVASDTVVVRIPKKWPQRIERRLWDEITGIADRAAERLRTVGIEPESVGDSTTADFARVLHIVETSGIRSDEGGYLLTACRETQSLLGDLMPFRSTYKLVDVPEESDAGVRNGMWETPQVKSVSCAERVRRRFVWLSVLEQFKPRFGTPEHHADTCRQLIQQRPEGHY